MKILITGASGFVGSNLKRYFEESGHTVFAPTRSEVDWLDLDTFYEWEINQHDFSDIDIVVHCAGIGGRRIKEDEVRVLYMNIALTQNVYNITSDMFPDAKFFFIGSGAEQDRTMGVSNIVWPKKVPKDIYGLSKCAISEYFAGISGTSNLRAFGLFGENEEQQRFVRTAVHAYRHKMPIRIHQDRRMDFFFVDDIARIIETMSEIYPNDKMHDINLSYEDRMLFLTEIAKFINTLDDHEVEIIVENKSLGRDYFGNPVQIKQLKKITPNLELIGQKEGIRRMYEKT